ncbi:MAG: hypothetical protein O2887_00600 [Bacteroidetes bacterium]|nr:hypothetical protein [Bacteroidota bacterium]MDA1118988.1 hypothetical protein [Bacteroidota bacterium]
MTNTLHRYGSAESFRDDYIIFAIPAKGLNDDDCIPKLKDFLRICAKHNPANIGNGNRSSLAPEKGLKPSAHWTRNKKPDWNKVIDEVGKSGTVSAVFAHENDAQACFDEVVKADFGLSVNMSTSVENAKRVAKACGVSRHSVEYALPFNDPHDHLPNSQVLELSTMCGHGMVSFNFAKKMLDMVREGRRTPEDAAATLVRFCPCGVYNPVRAKRLIEEACKEQR